MDKTGFLQSLREQLGEYYCELAPLLKEKQLLEDKLTQIKQCV